MSLVQAARRRIRLRTRLRRARAGWQQAVPRRLPAWSETVGGTGSEAVGGTGPGAPLGGDRAVVLADAAAANPRGRQWYGPRRPAGRLVLAGFGRWEIKRGGTAVVAGRVGAPLGRRQAAVLAELGLVACDPEPDPSPAGYAHTLATLAMTGVIVHAPELPAAVAARLSPELAELVRAPLPPRRGDPLGWELRSVRQRRAAMRGHAAGLARPPVSALLVTRRPERVAAAVAALAGQTYPELEIVVGTHGTALPPDLPAGDLPAGGRPVRVVPVPGDRCLGEALAAANRAAGGTLVTKVDDDDRYGPEHIWDLVLARHLSGATVVGKGAEFVYLEPDDLTVRRRMAAEIATDTVAGGTLTLAREELAALGGWPAVPRSVDRALLDRVLAAGGWVYRTHPFGFVYTRHDRGHTWQVERDHFRHDVRQRWRGLPRHEEFGTA